MPNLSRLSKDLATVQRGVVIPADARPRKTFTSLSADWPKGLSSYKKRELIDNIFAGTWATDNVSFLQWQNTPSTLFVAFLHHDQPYRILQTGSCSRNSEVVGCWGDFLNQGVRPPIVLTYIVRQVG